MKKYLIVCIIALAALTSCEQYDHDVIFVVNDKMEFNVSDISMYDSSANILYLKRSHSELSDIESGSFAFYDNGDPVLSGRFWPGYLSSTPSTPIIRSSPFLLKNFALRLETWNYEDHALLESERFTDVLSRNGLLHSGLAVTDASAAISGSELVFSLTVTNMDNSSLLIMDPVKTGPQLFRFFTNGIEINDPVSGNKVFSDNIQYMAPDPWNSWSMDWLSPVAPGESMEFTFTYTLSTALTPGEYEILFEYPGLSSQVSLDDLYQDDARIWLGDVIMKRLITIE
jgi:hypothetical protein